MCGNKNSKRIVTGTDFGERISEKWLPKSSPFQSQIDEQIDTISASRKNMKIVSKTQQNRNQVDANNHPKAMPKQVAKQIMNIVQNMFPLKRKMLQICFENYDCLRFNSLRARMERVSNKHQQLYQNSSQNL